MKKQLLVLIGAPSSVRDALEILCLHNQQDVMAIVPRDHEDYASLEAKALVHAHDVTTLPGITNTLHALTVSEIPLALMDPHPYTAEYLWYVDRIARSAGINLVFACFGDLPDEFEKFQAFIVEPLPIVIALPTITPAFQATLQSLVIAISQYASPVKVLRIMAYLFNDDMLLPLPRDDPRAQYQTTTTP